MGDQRVHRELREWPKRNGRVATENWESGHRELGVSTEKLGGFMENWESDHWYGSQITWRVVTENWESGHRELGEWPKRTGRVATESWEWPHRSWEGSWRTGRVTTGMVLR